MFSIDAQERLSRQGDTPANPLFELHYFDAIATLEGLKISQIIRQRVLGEKPQRLTGVNRDIYNELTRMGNNLNQMAKVLNYHQLVQKTVPAHTIIEIKGSLELALREIETLKRELKP